MDLDLNEAVETEIALPELDNVLAELDAMDGDTIEEIDTDAVEVEAADAVDAIEEEVPSVLTDDFLAELEMASAKQSVYETQAAETMPDIAETADGSTAASIKTKKARTTSKAASATPKEPADLEAVLPEFFDLYTDSNLTTADDLEAAKKGVIAKRPSQVKIAEKFDNLFTKVSVGKKPSTYVMLALDLLKAKGEFSSSDLIAHYKANNLGDGTARSQTGQIMVLFDVTGIAERAGQKMIARKNSKLVERIEALSAAPIPTA